jgi:hypothetical protein
VDPLKIGQPATMQKAFRVFSLKKKDKKDKKEKKKEKGNDVEEGREEDIEEEEGGGEMEKRRRWLKYMMTAPDGWRYQRMGVIIYMLIQSFHFSKQFV